MNIFESFQQKKAETLALLKQAEQWQWISPTEHQEMLERIDNDILTVGVVGQMKAGKSTFLNAFVFEKDVLPSATTPMTAALSVITYGTEEKVIAEFYSADEWAEQKREANRNLDDISDDLERSKVQAAQELVKQSRSLGGEQELAKLLGKTQEDKLENLVEYVGAEGRYVSITKSVRIEYPKEYLKGVEIVDTPGFNDPIVSREERTKDFLRRADVVLMMLYAGRPFDATDREIIFKHIASCGAGRLVIGINKYDIPLMNGEDESEIVSYVKDEIRKVCTECPDKSLRKMLLDTEPIPLSAEMALLSHLPATYIDNIERYSHAVNRYTQTFEFSGSAKLREKSYIDKLAGRVQEIISQDKLDILCKRPRIKMSAVAKRLEDSYLSIIAKSKEEVQNLSLSNEDLAKKLSQLETLQKRINKAIEDHKNKLDETLRNLRQDYYPKFRDAIDNTHKDLTNLVQNTKLFAGDKLQRDFDSCLNGLSRRILPDLSVQLKRELDSSIRRVTQALGSTIEGHIEKRIKDFSTENISHQIMHCVHEQTEKYAFNTLLDWGQNKEEKANSDSLLRYFTAIVFPAISFLGGIVIADKEMKAVYFERADQLKKIDYQSIVNDFVPQNNIFDALQEALEQEVFASLRTEIEDIQANKANRETQLATAQQTKQQTESKLSQLREQRQSLGL